MTPRRGIAIATVFAVAAIGLSLSDRAPSLARRAGAVLEGAWHRVEIAFAIDIDRDTIPWTADELAHLLLWGGGMLVLGLALRPRRLDRLAAALFVASLTLEVLQALVTAQRSLSLSDAAANGLGITVGLTIVVAADLIWPVRSGAAHH